MNNAIKEKIIKEVKQLKEIGECVGIEISKDKGLFIEVDINCDGDKEYFIELNEIDNENCYEPCGDYNESAEFNNAEMLIDRIKNYLMYHRIY